MQIKTECFKTIGQLLNYPMQVQKISSANPNKLF